LKDAINTTNEQVQQWANKSKELQKSHDELAKELAKMRRSSEERVQDILDGPTPQGCEAAMQYLRNAKEDLGWPETH